MRRPKKTPLSAEQKRLQRRMKREARKDAILKGVVSTGTQSITEKSPHEQSQFWSGIKARQWAGNILNSHRERPYWASIPYQPGPPPFSGYFPCSMLRKGNRWYFGFLFREHRDLFWEAQIDCRKELTGCVRW